MHSKIKFTSSENILTINGIVSHLINDDCVVSVNVNIWCWDQCDASFSGLYASRNLRTYTQTAKSNRVAANIRLLSRQDQVHLRCSYNEYHECVDNRVSRAYACVYVNNNKYNICVRIFYHILPCE